LAQSPLARGELFDEPTSFPGVKELQQKLPQ